MKFIPSLGEITSKTKEAFKRFPITITWAIVGTLFSLFCIEADFFDSAYYYKVILVFVLGISWLIATRFFEEQFSTDKSWLFLITLGFISLFYLSINIEDFRIDENSIIRFILYFIGGHLIVLVAPFILRWNNSAYFNYLKSVFVAIVRSAFFSMILYLGIILALLAIEHLFNIPIKGDRYFQVFVICLGIVNTWIYLSDFPKDVHNQLAINYTKALEVLVKYILIPLVILYLIILYAYSLKIVINWSLPKGWVSFLVLALAFLGFIIQVLINPIQKSIDSRAINRFHPWFYYLLLPLNLLLFVAIFKRINEYGITENRYFVLVLALWVLAMTLYMLFSKRKKIKVFPFSLASLAIIVSFGFWGAFSVSLKSQLKQFKKVYTEIKNTGFVTTYDKKQQLSSIVKFLNDKKQLDKLEPVLGFNPETALNTKVYNRLNYRLMDSLNIKVEKDSINNYHSYNYYHLSEDLSYTTKGYDYFKNFTLNSYSNSKKHYFKGYGFSLNKKNNTLNITNDNFNETIALDDFIKRFDTINNNENNEDIEAFTIKKDFKKLKVKIIFKNFTIINYKNTKSLRSGNLFVLIKEKNAE